MKGGQKITAFLVAVIMIFTMGVQAFAASTIDDVMFDLTTLGIMEGDENGDFLLDKELTRAEFACITVRFMNMRTMADNYRGEASFSDVTSEHWAFGSIEVLKGLNLIDGTGNGMFSPDEYVTAEQAVKILISTLGYSVYAEMNGSYPDGYMNQAIATGILDNVDLSSKTFTRESAARMVYNALDVEIVSVKYSDAYPSYEKSGETYREKFKGEQKGNLVKYTGIVTATPDAYLNTPRAGMKDNQIEIDDTLYVCNDANMLSYLGQKVDFYVDEEDSYEIVSIKLHKDNTVTSFDIEDIKSLSDTSISYYVDQTTKTETENITSGASVLINNRVVSSYGTETITALKN